MHLHAHSIGGYIVVVEAFKLLCHVVGCIMMGHQVFKSDSVLPTNLVDNDL